MALRPATLPRRVAGAGIIALAVLPVHRLLAADATGLAGAATVRSADVAYAYAWTGTLVIALIAALCARLLPPSPVAALLAAADRRLRAPTPLAFACFTALAAFLLCALFARFGMGGRPAHADAISQLLHARFLADGRLAGPTDDLAFWHIQNSVATANGWVSQYPPGHTLLLALGLLAGVPWMVGPLAVAATAGFGARIAEHVLADRALARAGALLVALSPFLLGIGGSFMNHATAAAFTTAGLWLALRAVDDRRFAWLAGAAFGCAFTIRPLVALAIAGAAAIAWLVLADRRSFAGRAGRAIVGAAPFVLLLGLYNAHFFGAPLRFGYDVALGPATGLGFGIDPWGNRYGPVEALGYTASDLLNLGTAALETPVSAVLLAGALLLAARRLTPGEIVLAAWALLPVLANVFYWHHGLYMGPRMLYEAAPAWILLATAATGRAWAALPEHAPLGFEPRAALAGGLVAVLLVACVSAPGRVRSWATPPGSVAAFTAPQAESALVFVHDAWTARLAMQLAGAGMRLDSVETALRQNPTCDVQTFVDAREGGAASPVTLDFAPRATDLPEQIALATGDLVRIDRTRAPAAACLRQAASDRNGILDLAPFVWQGDLPGAPAVGARFVRDLGPERNARLIAGSPGRTPMMLYTPDDGAAPVLVPYADGVRVLWDAPQTGEVP